MPDRVLDPPLLLGEFIFRSLAKPCGVSFFFFAPFVHHSLVSPVGEMRFVRSQRVVGAALPPPDASNPFWGSVSGGDDLGDPATVAVVDLCVVAVAYEGQDGDVCASTVFPFVHVMHCGAGGRLIAAGSRTSAFSRDQGNSLNRRCQTFFATEEQRPVCVVEQCKELPVATCQRECIPDGESASRCGGGNTGFGLQLAACPLPR